MLRKHFLIIPIIVSLLSGMTAFFSLNHETVAASADCAEDEHKWEKVTMTEPTCTTPGHWVWLCSVCNDGDEGGDIPALGHVETDVWTQTAGATCQEAGWQAHICSRCNEEYEWRRYPGIQNHAYNVTSIIPSTCTEEGMLYSSCRWCGIELNRKMPKEAHTYVFDHHNTPNCQQWHADYYKCSVCGDLNIRLTGGMGDHQWQQITQTAPTCTTPGHYVWLCSVCNDGDEGGELPALGHDYKVIEEKPATCGANGKKTYRCNTCNDEYSETTPIVGEHSWQQVTQTAPTCTTPGHYVYLCSVCNDGDEGGELPALGHDYKVIDEKPATCGANGKKTYRCNTCNDEYSETTPIVGEHSWQQVTQIEPTCTDPGHYVYLCSVCGDGDEGGDIPALGHDHQVIDHKDATCNTRGYDKYRCSRCNDEYEDKISATGLHSFGSIQTVPATCETPGYTYRECNVCGEVEDGNHIAAIGHSYTVKVKNSDTFKHAADCTRAETYFFTCSRCGDVQRDAYDGATVVPAPTWTVGEPLGHVWVKDQDRPATCTQNGEYHYTCSRCLDADYGIYEATGHNYVDNVCTICGDRKGTTECLEHNLVDGQCTVCGWWATEYAVSFYADGEVFKRIGASSGETVYLPSAPYKKGHDFVTYKYYDANGEFVKFTDSVRVYGNMSVYAVYEGAYITIHITDEVTKEILDVKILDSYTLGSSYTPPKHFGWNFTGYTRDGADIVFSANTPILEELHLTAHYDKTFLADVLEFFQGLSIVSIVIIVVGALVIFLIVTSGTKGKRNRGGKRRR